MLHQSSPLRTAGHARWIGEMLSPIITRIGKGRISFVSTLRHAPRTRRRPKRSRPSPGRSNAGGCHTRRDYLQALPERKTRPPRQALSPPTRPLPNSKSTAPGQRKALGDTTVGMTRTLMTGQSTSLRDTVPPRSTTRTEAKVISLGGRTNHHRPQVINAGTNLIN